MRFTESADCARTLLVDFGGLGLELADWAASADGSTDSSPGIARLLRQARISTLSVAGREAVTGFLLTGRREAIRVWPPGPVGFLGGWGHGERAQRPDVVIRADPVSLSPGGDQLILTSARIPDLLAADADTLLEYLNAGLEARAARLYRRDPHSWYLTLADAPSGPWWTPGELEGQHVLEFMPSGPGYGSLNGLITEVQMMLHEHPVNLRRTDAGLPPLNSLWPWGWYADDHRAEAPTLLRIPRIDDENGADAYATGIAILASGAEADAATDCSTIDAHAGATEGSRHQFVLVSPRSGETAVQFRSRIEHDWCGPWLRDLRQGRIRRVCIATVAGECAVVNRLDLFRFWRRSPRTTARR